MPLRSDVLKNKRNMHYFQMYVCTSCSGFRAPPIFKIDSPEKYTILCFAFLLPKNESSHKAKIATVISASLFFFLKQNKTPLPPNNVTHYAFIFQATVLQNYKVQWHRAEDADQLIPIEGEGVEAQAVKNMHVLQRTDRGMSSTSHHISNSLQFCMCHYCYLNEFQNKQKASSS